MKPNRQLTLVFISCGEKGYIAFIEEIPSLIALGDTFVEALNNLLLELNLFELSNFDSQYSNRYILKYQVSSYHLN